MKGKARLRGPICLFRQGQYKPVGDKPDVATGCDFLGSKPVCERIAASKASAFIQAGDRCRLGAVFSALAPVRGSWMVRPEKGIRR
jgi:hypothetical protein